MRVGVGANNGRQGLLVLNAPPDASYERALAATGIKESRVRGGAVPEELLDHEINDRRGVRNLSSEGEPPIYGLVGGASGFNLPDS